MDLARRNQIPSIWSFNEWMTYPGRVRDLDDRPINGFLVRDTKKKRKVSIVCNGYFHRHYRYPLDAKPPKHAMIRWLNVPMCGMPFFDQRGISMSDNDAILNAVYNGEKPVGDVFFNNAKEGCKSRFACVEKAKLAGFEVIEYTRPHNEDQITFVMIGVNKPLNELFDLDEIVHFYQQHACWVKESCFDEVSHLTPAQALQTYDWASPESSEQLIITGLCLGYALESTLAIILEAF